MTGRVAPSSRGAVPLVSVITPCYNAGPFVAETIESVRAQTYPHIEHIVVDDCSTDGSWEVLQRYSDQLTAVRLEQNGGGSQARNRGAALARGEFLMFLDADDVIAPNTIEALVETARENPEKITFCPWKRLRQVEGRWTEQPAEVPLPLPEADPLKGWLEDVWVPPCAVLWPRNLFERTGGWDEMLVINQDGDIMMRAFAGGAVLIQTASGKAFYRAHETPGASVSSGVFTQQRCLSRMRILGRLADQLARTGRMHGYAPQLGSHYYLLASRAFLECQPELGRECIQLAQQYGPDSRLAQTRIGQLISKAVGIERKEQVARILGQFGIMTPARRRVIANRKAWLVRNGSPSDAGIAPE